MFKNWSMPSQKTYSNVMRLLESPYMRSMPTDKILPWCKILQWQSQKQSSVKALLSPWPTTHHVLVAVRQFWEQEDCTTMVFGDLQVYWAHSPWLELQGLCKFHHHKKATGMLHAEQLLPDIWLAFQIFHLILTSLSIKSTAIIRPSSKSVKMLHSET